MTIKPTIEEFKDAWMEELETYEQVHQKADPSWRHGCYMFTVLKRLSDNTYWGVNWQKSGDGEYNSLRDGDCSDNDVFEVEPYEVTITEYKVKKLNAPEIT